MVKRPRSTSLSLTAYRSALSRFFTWWMGELAAFVPASVRLWWREADRIVLVSFEDSRPIFRRPVGHSIEEIPSTEANGQRRLSGVGRKFRYMLCLAQDQVLQRTLSLPSAVAENLRQTLSFELDRYTPFKPDQAYFDFRIRGHGAEQKKILVDLLVAPRPLVDQAVARAAALELDVAGAVLADDALRYGSECRNLLPVSARKSRGSGGWLVWRVGLGLLAVLLTVALLAIPIWQKRNAAISLLAPMAEAKTAAEATDVLRDRLKSLVDEHNLLPDKKWSGHSALRAIDELGKRLPDDTFVIQFDFDGTAIQVQGESASSASLVETLEASPLFKDVGFKAQLTKIQGTASDRFHIAATLEASEKSAVAAALPEAQAPGAAASSNVVSTPGVPAAVGGGKP